MGRNVHHLRVTQTVKRINPGKSEHVCSLSKQNRSWKVGVIALCSPHRAKHLLTEIESSIGLHNLCYIIHHIMNLLKD